MSADAAAILLVSTIWTLFHLEEKHRSLKTEQNQDIADILQILARVLSITCVYYAAIMYPDIELGVIAFTFIYGLVNVFIIFWLMLDIVERLT